MNEEQVRERARERRLSADLAAVLGTTVAGIDAVEASPARRRGGWLAAVMVVLGVAVAFGVAQLRDGGDELQERAFDPVDPWYEAEWPFRVPFDVLREPADVAALPADRTRFTVILHKPEGRATLDALLRRDRIDELLLMTGEQGEVVVPWSAIAARVHLRSLAISGAAGGVDARSLRALRRLPDLRTLALMSIGRPLDAELGAALVELPKLRQLTCSQVAIEPEGLSALSGLPDLDTLVLHVDESTHAEVGELLSSIARLRTLRALMLEGELRVDAASLGRLQVLDRLAVLALSHLDAGGDVLAAVPERVESLMVGRSRRWGVDDVAKLARLRRLRSLDVHVPLADEDAQAALCQQLAGLPLERFQGRVGQPDERLWKVLQERPGLRRLDLATTSATLPAVLAAAVRCVDLEMLVLKVDALPDPEVLAVVRGHAKLRRIRLVRFRPRTPVPTAEQLRAMRDAAGVDVEVR